LMQQLLALVVLCLLTPVTVAQNLVATPLYGTARLTAGFTDDPYPVEVLAGGQATVGHLGPECVGFITDSQADFILEYQAGISELGFFVTSEVDTTLIVNDPRGNWHCSDDNEYVNDAGAGINFFTPISGSYHVWVGTYNLADTGANALLTITGQDEQYWSSLNRGANVNTGQAKPARTQQPVEFGDDRSAWSNDGECDDPRFSGAGMAETLLEEDQFRDATDCRTLYEQGLIRLMETGSESSLGRIERGSLSASDLARPGGAFMDVFSFEGTQGETALLELRSSEFDTLLLVRSPSGDVFENDDYNGDSGRSMLTLTVEQTGLFQVEVSSFARQETGDYTLTIQQLP
ncbi:MAG: hypothetical protein VW039_10180, partial [Halieaceae bacterium]